MKHPSFKTPATKVFPSRANDLLLFNSILYITILSCKRNGAAPESGYIGIWPLLRAIYCNYTQVRYSGVEAPKHILDFRDWRWMWGCRTKVYAIVAQWENSIGKVIFPPLLSLHSSIKRNNNMRASSICQLQSWTLGIHQWTKQNLLS